MENKVRKLHDTLMQTFDKNRVQVDTAIDIINTVFCLCDCGTPLFVKHVTEFPPGYTKIYCPDCVEETEVFVESPAQ